MILAYDDGRGAFGTVKMGSASGGSEVSWSKIESNVGRFVQIGLSVDAGKRPAMGGTGV